MSPIRNHINFSNYTADELVKIVEVIPQDPEYDISEESYATFKRYIEARMPLPYFSNARTVRNAMDRARMNCAIKTFKKSTTNGKTGACAA